MVIQLLELLRVLLQSGGHTIEVIPCALISAHDELAASHEIATD